MNETNQTQGVFSDEALREIAEMKVKRRLAVQVHAASWVLVNAFLTFVNYLATPGSWWVLWPVTSWAVGLAFHAVSYLAYARGVVGTASKGVIYHLTAYLTVTPYLFFVNWLTTTPPVYWWATWPAGTWAVGVLFHVFLATRGKGGEKGRSYVERQVEKELAKLKRQGE
ncbi:MAG: hypothetical protein Kow0069_00160 [Promethearchaeota archaeon]